MHGDPGAGPGIPSSLTMTALSHFTLVVSPGCMLLGGGLSGWVTEGPGAGRGCASDDCGLQLGVVLLSFHRN